MVGAGVVGAGADFVGARAQFVGAGPRPLHLRCHSSPSHSLRALHPCHATVWVYCEDPQLCGDHYKECWLKHLAHPDATAPAKEGPDVGWTTGLMSQHSDDASLAEGVSRRYAQRRGAAHASPPPCPPPPLASLLAPPPCPVRTVACRHPCWPSGGPHRAAACLPAAAWRPERTFHVVITAAGSAVHWQSRVAYYWYKKIRKQCEVSAGGTAGGGWWWAVPRAGGG